MRCGGSLELHTIQTGMSTMGSYVKCSKCELQGKTFNDYDGNHMKLATEFWNTRAADSINQALVDAFNPRTWTLEMHEAWHKNLPDMQKAFEALREAALALAGMENNEPIIEIFHTSPAKLERCDKADHEYQFFHSNGGGRCIACENENVIALVGGESE